MENKFNDLPALSRLPKGREWIYFLQADLPDGLVKIGHSTNLKWRLCGLQTQCPVRLKLIQLVEAPAGAEFAIHQALAAHRSHGEWFLPSEELHRLRRALPDVGSIEAEEFIALMGKFGVKEFEAWKFLDKARFFKKHLEEGEERPKKRTYWVNW